LQSRASDFIDRAVTHQPFFLYLAPAAPHLDSSTTGTCKDNWARSPSVGVGTATVPYPDSIPRVTVPLPRPPSFDEADMTDKPPYLQGADDGLGGDTSPYRAAPPMADDRQGIYYPDYDAPSSQSDFACSQMVYQDRMTSLEPIDTMIGSVATKLQSLQLMGSTVIIFTSDNGFFHGEHRLHEKIMPYEEGTHVPLVVRWGSTGGQSKVSSFIVNTDFAKTIAEIANAPIPAASSVQSWTGVDGLSFRGFLPGGTPPTTWRYRFLLEHYKTLVDGTSTDEPFPGIPNFLGIRTTNGYPDSNADPNSSDAVYLQYDSNYDEVYDNGQEFYDLDVDPYQLTNGCFADPYCGISHDGYADLAGGVNARGYLAELAECNGTASANYTCQALETNAAEQPPP